MRRLSFVTHGEGANHTGALVDAEHLADLGRAMAEDPKEPPHPLAQQTEHDGLGKCDIDLPGERTRSQGLLDSTGRRDNPGTVRAIFDPLSIRSLLHR